MTTSFLISIRQAIPIVLARCHGVYVIIMDMTVQAKNGNVEVRVVRRSDHRWDGQYRYLPNRGEPTGWCSAAMPEGFVAPGIAISAAIFAGRLYAEKRGAGEEPGLRPGSS